MKKTFLTLIICVLETISMFAQIQFEAGTWNEVKAKAKKEKKMVFIDTYTSWCGPCKMMLNTIFKMQNVADFYNQNFICYKIDAEKGEGVAIAKEFGINSFPTYLFLDGNGTLFYRSGGSMPAEKFIAEGEAALDLFKDKKSMADWDKEYKSKKNDAAFLKSYIVKRAKLKLDNADLFDECVVACTGNTQELLDREFLMCTQSHDACVNAGGPFFNFMLDNLDKVLEITGVQKEMFLYNIPFMTTFYSVKKASEDMSEKMFEQILKGNERLMVLREEKGRTMEYKLRCQYYSKTKQEENLNKYAAVYAKEIIAQIPEYTKNDNESFEKYVERLSESNEQFKGKAAAEIAMMLSFSMNNTTASLSFELRDLSLQVSTLSKDANLKYQALEWALLAYKLFDNFSNTEAVAEAYHNLGRQDDARFWIKYTTNKIPAMAGDDIRNRVKERADRIR